MNSDCYFDECKDCMNRQYSDDLCCCAANRLGLAWYRLLKEIPIINKFIEDNKCCDWFEKEE